ncbi:MAG TPA: lipocalin-like domain-containing protein, partial [Candidatus Tumulicola sp.]
MELSRKRLFAMAASFGVATAASNVLRAGAAPTLEAPPKALIGAWALESFVIDEPGAGEKPRFGPNPVGYLIYTADGHMSATLMGSHRAPLPAPDGSTATHAEVTSSLSNFLSYAGRYEIRGNHVFHHVEVSVFTNLVGTTLERQFTLDGNTLTI